MNTRLRYTASLCFALSAWASLPAQAAVAWSVVDDGLLATQRGGFITPHGLEINFSLEKVVMVNGMLQAHTVFQLDKGTTALAGGASAGSLNGVPAAGLPAAGSSHDAQARPDTDLTSPKPITSLPVTIPTPEALNNPGTTVLTAGMNTIIQNTLDQQNIQSIKVLNLEISNLRSLQSMGLNNRIRDGLIGTLR